MLTVKGNYTQKKWGKVNFAKLSLEAKVALLFGGSWDIGVSVFSALPRPGLMCF